MKASLPCFLSTLLLVSVHFSYAQESRFYIPTEIQQAYEKGTRSYDGRPGSNYWQNTVDYTIEVEVMPDAKKLEGKETVVFHNNSPDELDQIVIRLYHDAFREGNPRAYRVRPDDVTEGVEITRLTLAGAALDMNDPRAVRRQNTNMILRLPEPLPGGESLTLEIDWAQQIPETTIRTGAYDSTSFFLAYWYPQVAVYDDLFGWDQLAYDFSTEFYNNLANYDVRITAPEQFTVLSTGVLQNPEEVLSDTHLQRYREAQTATETVTIVGPEDLEEGLRYQSGAWHYTATEVPDFAFCLSDHHCWDAVGQLVEDRDVLVHSFYPADLREQAAMLTANQQKMMKHFSEDAPGIPYPYPEFTTYVSGKRGGGMEYPMMANNGSPGLGVTVHEMFHTYFPMYVRVNEKRFAWMDEGWADFATSFLIRRFFEEDESTPQFATFASQLSGTLGTISDLPLITSTQFLDNTNYGYASYPLPGFLYSVLYHHLGEEVFMECWREYIRRWAKKSPTPYDFMYTFEDVSGQDLNWFWEPWFFRFGNVDVQIQSFDNGKLTVENAGNRPLPLYVRVTYQDGTEEAMDYSAGIWQKSNTYTVEVPRPAEVAAIAANFNVADANLLDNFYPSLQEQYGSFDIPEGMLGTYPINEFPVSVIISEKDGMLYLEVPGAGMSSYLLPGTEEDSFKSLNGEMQIQFEREEGNYTGMKARVEGMQVTARKE